MVWILTDSGLQAPFSSWKDAANSLVWGQEATNFERCIRFRFADGTTPRTSFRFPQPRFRTVRGRCPDTRLTWT